MKDIGKGIGIGLCGISIAIAAIYTRDPRCCFAFIALICIASVWEG